ncbi:uncharacterized protein LOC118318137 isoform X2 [Scophthalmus maximus]|uniref:uncharacterized protein LOC118318137 isoform X2 n=1 Tax=Scophthalmus maximus TaxID=52904 RepID=UPI001FA88554|nr:uncharacterized protein LOC118318137 isoform X2 [Scophthalmus maximus]
MNLGEEPFAGPGQAVVPPFSTRTVRHPSLMPLCVAAGFARQQRACDVPALQPITPEEIFYTDPTMSCGRRIPNISSDFEVFEFFRLNTPPPVMSACLAPPSRPDPFRSGSHPTRDLGSTDWRLNHIRSSAQPSRAILQLTWEEDQAITNLLKLHQSGESDETLAAAPVNVNACFYQSHPSPTVSTIAEELYKPFFSGGQRPRTAILGNQSQQGKCWSVEELEAADTLLSCSIVRGEDRIWARFHQESAVTLPYRRPHWDNKELAMSNETQPGTETLTALRSTDSTPSGTGHIRFTRASQNGAAGRGGFSSVEDQSVSGEFSEASGQVLSDMEGDAVRALLSFGDRGTLNIPQ